MKYFDTIIVGSGMAGLYASYKIRQYSSESSFIVLEKYSKKYIGGRANNHTFYGSEIVTGAGIGRKNKDRLLIDLMNELGVEYSEFKTHIDYANFTPVDVVKIVNKLKVEYKKHPELHNKTFKKFFIKLLGYKLYKDFVLSSGYTDYENADVYDTLYNYGMDDNKGGWIGLHIDWKKLVDSLYEKIGQKHFRFSSEVIQIKKLEDTPCLFEITTNNTVYYSNKVIIATTIEGIKKLVPNASNKNSLYQQIHGQPFIRLYAKFDKRSSEIIKKYVNGHVVVPEPLQKIITINADNGVYMICYNDNASSLLLQNHLRNTRENRDLYAELVEKSLGIHEKLTIIAIKDYYWSVGTHYYEPLKKFINRNSFIRKAQNPEKGMLVVGEVVSKHQGWVEGALESVKLVVTKKWVENVC
jgi:hypothetical protein